MSKSTDSIFCPSCGSKVSEGKFCSSCGTAVPRVEAEQDAVPDGGPDEFGEKSSSKADERKWWEKKRFAFPIIAFVVLAFFASLAESDEEAADDARGSASETANAPSSTSEEENAAEGEASSGGDGEDLSETTGRSENSDAAASEEAEAEIPTDLGVDVPDSQAAFVQRFQDGIEGYNNAGTELQAANALNERDAELCAITSQGQVDGWVGVVESVGANGDGKGVLAVELAPDLIVKTWNNAFSDIGDGTLIEPSSALFEKVLPLEGGERIQFSGRFVGGSNHCLKDSRLTDYGRATDPDFIFKFRDLSVVG